MSLRQTDSRDIPRRRGFTLVEVMIAMVVTMIIMLAISQLFKDVGDIVRNGRAVVEIAGQVRTVGSRLRLDLSQVSLQVRPWPDSGSGHGYFEYVEGADRDERPNPATDPDTSLGDADDIIMMTCRSQGEPFVGTYNGNTIESQLAEVIWWTTLVDINDTGNNPGVWDPGESYTLHRRVLLIRPDLNDANGVLSSTAVTDLASFYNSNDVSVRFDHVTSTFTANSLADLTKRENRFAHNPPDLTVPASPTNAVFPFPLDVALLNTFVQNGDQTGNDVVAVNVVSFDVRVYDPTAEVRSDETITPAVPGTIALIPGDPGWLAATTVIGQGAYVDLNYAGNSALSQFSGPTAFVDANGNGTFNPGEGVADPTYCTWSRHYEHDGLNQDGNRIAAIVDQGTNGLDDDNINGIDDSGERETTPPYPFPLRGLQVTLRVIDRSLGEVRQNTINSNFVPE